MTGSIFANATGSRPRCVVPKATYSDYQNKSSQSRSVVTHVSGTTPLLEEAHGNGLIDWIHNLSSGLFEEDAKAEEEEW